MLSILLWIMTLLGSPSGPPKRGATVYVFLADTCPISQRAAVTLRALYAQYAAQGVSFVGVFPAPATTVADLATFAKSYQLSFPLQPDPGQRLTRKLHAHVTPEAVLLGPDGRTICYQGRLDDAFASLGRPRAVVQHHELADALAAVVAGQLVAVPQTEPVGCFIEALIGTD